MRVNAIRDFKPMFITEFQVISLRSTRGTRKAKSFKKEGGQVAGVKRYAIGMFRFWRARCMMPLQTVLCNIDLSNKRHVLGSLKLGQLREAAQITDNVLVLVA